MKNKQLSVCKVQTEYIKVFLFNYMYVIPSYYCAVSKVNSQYYTQHMRWRYSPSVNITISTLVIIFHSERYFEDNCLFVRFCLNKRKSLAQAVKKVDQFAMRSLQFKAVVYLLLQFVYIVVHLYIWCDQHVKTRISLLYFSAFKYPRHTLYLLYIEIHLNISKEKELSSVTRTYAPDSRVLADSDW